MEEVYNLLEERENYLLQIKNDKEKALISSPKGSLRICSHGNRTQYYQRNDPKDFNGTYIREKDIHIAQGLAQKDYDKKVLRAVEKELKTIQKYFLQYPSINAEQVYETLHKDRQKLIIADLLYKEGIPYRYEYPINQRQVKRMIQRYLQ